MSKRIALNLDPSAAIARDVAFHAGRLNNNHDPYAVVVAILQTLANYAANRPLSCDSLERALGAVLVELDRKIIEGPMGQCLIVPRSEPSKPADER